MKIQGGKKIHYDSGPNLTPLVDVVMVILIFLMLAGSFGANERYIVSDIPIEAKGAGGKQDNAGPLPSRLMVKVKSDGPYYRATLSGFATVSSTSAGSAYQELQNDFASQVQAYRANNIDPDTVQVFIAPDGNVTLDNLLVVYQAALVGGFKKVGFQTS